MTGRFLRTRRTRAMPPRTPAQARTVVGSGAGTGAIVPPVGASTVVGPPVIVKAVPVTAESVELAGKVALIGVLPKWNEALLTWTGSPLPSLTLLTPTW